MKIITLDELDLLLPERVTTPSALHASRRQFQTPSDSGKRAALANTIGQILASEDSIIVEITSWGIWPSSENMALFYAFRSAHDESRPLIEAPVHIFERGDTSSLSALLCIILYFLWDATVYSRSGTTLLRFDNDEYWEALDSSLQRTLCDAASLIVTKSEG